MPLTFTEADQAYRSTVEASGRELASAIAAARSVPQINLNGNDITHAVLLRLKSFFLAQSLIKSELNKIYAAPAADFFVETVIFFLKTVLEKLAPTLSVSSEKNIVPKKGSMRPDISIWRGDMLVSAIECKTQLGWNRDGWLTDFEERETRLAAAYPSAQLFLLVMTASNWSGFGEDKRVGEQFFVLLDDIWPNEFTPSTSGSPIVHTIEKLFENVLSHAAKN